MLVSLRACRCGPTARAAAAASQRSPSAAAARGSHHHSICSSRQLRAHLNRHRSMATNAAADASAEPPADPIVQWVVLRRDLWQDLGWPLGAVVAQACHASTSAVFTHLSDELTQAYIHADNIDHMHKVVLEIKSEQQLVNLSQKLQQEGIAHKLWVEQPENYPTCLATKPYRKSQAAAHFKKLQLCKAALGTAAKS